MNPLATVSGLVKLSARSVRSNYALSSLIAGLFIPFGFAPFHQPGLAILGLALLFANLTDKTKKQSFYAGTLFGVGFFGFGITWIYVSIHEFGHLNAPCSGLITFLFVLYLALFPGIMAMLYQKLAQPRSALFKCVLFSALWCLSEYLRAILFTGFPWLLIGFGQIDTPLSHLLPIVGVYGVGFIGCFAATLLATGIQTSRTRWIAAAVLMLITPSVLKHHDWTTLNKHPLSVGIIQANLSMRDKWDEALFWKLLARYDLEINKLLGKADLIVMPESAIPVPANYVSDVLENINQQARLKESAILLGIPQPTTVDDTAYYNTLSSLGLAKGTYLKQHLVPFGEFIPQVFQRVSQWLDIPVANMQPGASNQALVQVNHHPIASLICYELAYPNIVRAQMPQAEWIVSISDDGWFGHSLAMYQQLQMAQVLSLQTGRFQLVANNDGLSSIVNEKGEITASLPAFSSGVLRASISPASGKTPWVYWGDTPVLLMSLLTLIASMLPLGKIRFRRIGRNRTHEAA
jgi:apolipoprotein N-acyltransferase